MAQTKLYQTLLLLFLSSIVYAKLEERVNWDSKLYVDHPLVGKIWSSKTEEFLSVEDLEEAFLDASYLILGEKHDNPDHHALQLSIITHLIEGNQLSILAFEMMDSDFQELLDNIQAERLESLDAVKEYLDWDLEGWEWSFYGPLIMVAYEFGVPMAGSNITSSRMMEIYSLQALPPEIDILKEETIQQLNLDIDESHCGLLPESQFPAMVRVQQGRDYAMSQSLGSKDIGAIKVLIAGNYHARKDLGVPNYLMADNSDLVAEEIVSVSLMEVDPLEMEPKVYLQQHGETSA